jgi:glucan phosphoethanolaminetransferase (alkaline phosphatase superfamily)
MLLAEAISIIFGVPWVFIIGWALLFSSGLVKSQIIFMSIAFFILYILIPGFYMLYSLKRGYIEDFDMTKRQERYGILSVYLVAHLMNLALAFLLRRRNLLRNC